MGNQLLANSVVTGSLYALVTVGFALTYNTAGFYNLGHGAVFVVGAYTGYVVYRVLGLGLPATIVVTAGLAGLTGLIINGLVFRPLAHRRAPSLVLFIASLGVLVATEGLVATLFGNETIIFTSGPSPSFEWLGARLTVPQILSLAIALVALLALLVFFRQTTVGKRIRAVADDRDLAVTVGLPVHAMVSHVFLWGSMLAGLAGLLVGIERTVQPGSGMVAVLWAMVASIVGGIGSFVGPIGGAFLLGLLENVAVVVFPSEWKSTVVFSTLIVFFFVRPAGLFGKPQ